jgi:hypothetical protein
MSGYRDVTLYGPVSAGGELACTVSPSNAPTHIDRIEVLAYSLLRSELNVHHSNNCIDFQYGATKIPAFSVEESSTAYDDNNLPRYVVGDSGLGISPVVSGFASSIAVVKTDGAYTATTTVGPQGHPVNFDVDAASVLVAEPYTYVYEVDMFIAPDVSAICAALANATVYWDYWDAGAGAAAPATVLTPEPRNGQKYTVSVALLDLRPTHGVRHVVSVEYTLKADDAVVHSWSHTPVSLQTLQSRSALPQSGEFSYAQGKVYKLAIALTFATGETLLVEKVDALCTGTVVVPPWVQPNWPAFGSGDNYTVAKNTTDAANALIGHLVLHRGLINGGRLQLSPAETGFVVQSAVTKYYQINALRVSAAFIDLLRSELGLLVGQTPASDTRAADEAYQTAGREARGMGMAPDRVYHLAQLAYDYVLSLPTEVMWDAVRVSAWRIIREDVTMLTARRYEAYYTPYASNAALTLDASPISLPHTFLPGTFDFKNATRPGDLPLVNVRFKPELTSVLESRFAESTTPTLFMNAVREAYSKARDDDLPELSLLPTGGGEFRHSRPFVVLHVDRLATLLSLDARVFDKTPDTHTPYASSKRAADAAKAHVLSLTSSRSFAQTSYEVLERFNRSATRQRCFILRPLVANVVTATMRVGPYTTAVMLRDEVERAMNAAVSELGKTLAQTIVHPVVVRLATPYIEIECATNLTLLFGTGASVLRSAHRLLGFRNADTTTTTTTTTTIRAPFPYDIGDDPKMLRVTVYVNGTEATPMYYETRDEEECTFLMYIGSLPSILQTQSDPCCTNAVPLLRMSDYGSKVVHMQQTLQKIDRIALRFGVHLPSSSSSSTGDAPLYNFRNQNVLVVLRLWEVAEAGKRADSYNRSIFVTQQQQRS